MDVPAPPAVPGFTLETLVRFSRSGETWLVRRVATGEQESLTLVRDALVGAAEPLTRFRHAGAVPVTEVVAAGRHVALLSPVPPPHTLAALCVARPVLDPGEVVGLGVPLARALAAAHDRGLVHGDLDPVDIALTPEGEPALVGLGVAELAGAGVAPADDVHALAMILRSLLGEDRGPRAEAVRAALGAALSGHPAARPEAGELAGVLAMTCPPQPLRGLPRPAPVLPVAPARARPRVPALSSTAVTAALAVVGLLLLLLAAPVFGRGRHHADGAAAAGAPPVAVPTVDAPIADAPVVAAPVVGASSAPARPQVSHATAPTATQWQHTLQRLVTARDGAFISLDASALKAVDAPGSSAAAIDASRLQALRRSRVHARGLTSRVTGVAVAGGGAQASTLSFEESSGAYDLVTSAGVVIEHRAAAAPQWWSVSLVNGPGGWRAASVQPGTGAPG